jgi:hypothetical protein
MRTQERRHCHLPFTIYHLPFVIEQIETIRRWVEQGMIEGDKNDLPPAPSF